jgi:homoserine dehydrogenase
MMLIHSLLVNRNDHAWAAGLCVWGAPPVSAAKGALAKRLLGGVLRLRDIWNAQRVQLSPAAAVGAAIPFLFANKASATESKRILTVHSFE